MTARFVEIADRVHVLREPLLHVNVTLVVGDGAALLVDTLSTAGQARELAEAARAVTPHPWTVVNTHHHFDHCFGNAILAADPPRPVYAHALAAAVSPSTRPMHDADIPAALTWSSGVPAGQAARAAASSRRVAWSRTASSPWWYPTIIERNPSRSLCPSGLIRKAGRRSATPRRNDVRAASWFLTNRYDPPRASRP